MGGHSCGGAKWGAWWCVWRGEGVGWVGCGAVHPQALRKISRMEFQLYDRRVHRKVNTDPVGWRSETPQGRLETRSRNWCHRPWRSAGITTQLGAVEVCGAHSFAASLSLARYAMGTGTKCSKREWQEWAESCALVGQTSSLFWWSSLECAGVSVLIGCGKRRGAQSRKESCPVLPGELPQLLAPAQRRVEPHMHPVHPECVHRRPAVLRLHCGLLVGRQHGQPAAVAGQLVQGDEQARRVAQVQRKATHAEVKGAACGHGGDGGRLLAQRTRASGWQCFFVAASLLLSRAHACIRVLLLCWSLRGGGQRCKPAAALPHHDCSWAWCNQAVSSRPHLRGSHPQYPGRTSAARSCLCAAGRLRGCRDHRR